MGPGERPTSREKDLDDTGAPRVPLRAAKASRIRKRPQFQAIMRTGQRRFTTSFIFFLQPSPLPIPRLGITVTKKAGNAVRRNRLKRLVREAFRLHPELFRRPVDVVVVAKRDNQIGSLEEVVGEFRHVLGRHFR